MAEMALKYMKFIGKRWNKNCKNYFYFSLSYLMHRLAESMLFTTVGTEPGYSLHHHRNARRILAMQIDRDS